MSDSQSSSYSLTQIFLHWAIAALIVFQLVFGESMGDLKRAVRNGGTPDAMTDFMANAHIWIGIAVLALTVLRLAVRFLHGAPAPLPGSKAQELAAKAVHLLLYALMILAPVSGLIAWYGGVHLAEEVHEVFKPAFILLIAIHVLGAVYHQLVLKDGTMQRMARSRG